MLAEFKNSLTQKEVEAYEKEADIRALNAIYDNRPEILKHLRDTNE